ncbi:MAG: NAD+ synthase, partial [Acidobacteriota bacterium]|nr:NAD+ synthase [Acidobacteriota bacterium]
MKIALAQINTTVGDFAGNTERMINFASRALEERADLVVFPELAVCGYPPRDLIERPDFVERCESELARLARALPPIAVLTGSVRRSAAAQGKAAADVAALLSNGGVQADYAKGLLPFYDVFDESRYFEPGSGPLVYPFAGERLGLTVCEDAWNDKAFWKRRLYSRDPVEETAAAGATVLLNIAASPFAAGKTRLREKMLRTIARERRIPVVYVNLVGGNDSLVFDGSSCAFDSQGSLSVRAASFEEDLVFFETGSSAGPIVRAPQEDAEAILNALVLGTRDYARKCGFGSVIVGLSGGIDSSLVAAIAARAAGAENVYGVAMPGPFSSPGSLIDAEALARNLGIHYRVIPITPIYESYLQALATAFEGRPRDVTEENVQARIRGNILMALSNKFGSLVLSTGNKSELAAGYCTLYGDMAGGLAVIGDVPKTMVYELARWINHDSGGAGLIPASSLEKPPSAELRPDQKDQDTLPPYGVLDAVLRAYIEENQSAGEIAANLGFDQALVRSIVRRVARAEYKRQQAAPSLKVTSKAFGVGRRFP